MRDPVTMNHQGMSKPLDRRRPFLPGWAMILVVTAAYALFAVVLAIADAPVPEQPDHGWFNGTWFHDWGVAFGIAGLLTYLAWVTLNGIMELFMVQFRGVTSKGKIGSHGSADYQPFVTPIADLRNADGSMTSVRLSTGPPNRLYVGRPVRVRYVPKYPILNVRLERWYHYVWIACVDVLAPVLVIFLAYWPIRLIIWVFSG